MPKNENSLTDFAIGYREVEPNVDSAILKWVCSEVLIKAVCRSHISKYKGQKEPAYHPDCAITWLTMNNEDNLNDEQILAQIAKLQSKLANKKNPEEDSSRSNVLVPDSPPKKTKKENLDEPPNQNTSGKFKSPFLHPLTRLFSYDKENSGKIKGTSSKSGTRKTI